MTMSAPQFEIHPLSLGAAVPGVPVEEVDGVQKSLVVPHCPQTSQQALRGHSFRVLRSESGGAWAVPLTCGPQTAFATEAGIGG